MNPEVVKCFLPGEGVFVRVLRYKDNYLVGRIDNHTVSPLHGYKFGDVVTFKKKHYNKFDSWELAPKDEQLPAFGVVK